MERDYASTSSLRPLRGLTPQFLRAQSRLGARAFYKTIILRTFCENTNIPGDYFLPTAALNSSPLISFTSEF